MDRRQERKLCTFHVRCPSARHVYLSGSFADRQQPIVVPLRPGAGGVWNAPVALQSGTYRFRFYVDDGQFLTWFHPPGRPQAWDEVLVVGTDEPPGTRGTRWNSGDDVSPSSRVQSAWGGGNPSRPGGGDAAWVQISSLPPCDSDGAGEVAREGLPLLKGGAPRNLGRPWVPVIGEEDVVRKNYGWSHMVGGRKRVLETDDPAEYLQCRIDALAGDFCVASDVQVTQFAGDWLQVVVRPGASGGGRSRCGSRNSPTNSRTSSAPTTNAGVRVARGCLGRGACATVETALGCDGGRRARDYTEEPVMVTQPLRQTQSEMIQVLIVDDHPVLRQGLMQVIDEEHDMVVCGEAEDACHALEEMESSKPDIVVVDISLNGRSGLELVREIKARRPSLPVLVYSMYDESMYAERALRAGASGYVMKREEIAEVLTALRRIIGGHVYLSPAASTRMVHRAVDGTAMGKGPPLGQLSDRELEVFQFLGQGLSTRQISERLYRSVKTIESHRENIKSKLELKTSGELLRYAVEHTLELERSGGSGPAAG
jgi:DNA-binding NarL/FixJ family response regulator